MRGSKNLYQIDDVAQLGYFPSTIQWHEVYPDIFVNKRITRDKDVCVLQYVLHTVVQIELTPADLLAVNTRNKTHQLNIDRTDGLVVVTFCL